MRTLGVWGVAASLGIALAALGGVAAEKPSEETRNVGLARWEKFRGKSPHQRDAKDEKEKAEAAKFQAEAKAREEKVKAGVAQARENHFRQVAALDQLELLAQEANDKAALNKIDALRERSWKVYLKRTSHLKPGAAGTAELDEPDHLGDLGDKPSRRGGAKP